MGIAGRWTTLHSHSIHSDWRMFAACMSVPFMNGYYNRWAVCVCHVQLTKMPFQKNVCLIYLLCTLKMSRHLLKTIIFLLVSFTSFLFHSFIGSTILRGQNVEFHHWPLSAPVSAVIRSALHPLIHSLNPMCQQTFRTCIIFNDYTYIGHKELCST